ncbi:hypothetical protein BKA82DRAFT_4217684 [Pisolithus tinctorius]|nr:hypothetical protein BKA82DRAFT_4217684 [Pisolithus tinctorius]
MTPDASHALPGLPGSDVLRPMSRASDDKFQSQFSYGSGVGDAPTTPAHTHTSSVSDNVDRGIELPEVKRLKLWAQKVATKFELKASQFLELSMLIDVGKTLQTGDLRLRIWQQATNYRVLNGIEEIKTDSANTKNAMETATAGLRSGFQLNVDQTMQILIVCKDMLVQAGRTKYKTLHVDVEERLRSRADLLGFLNVFNNPANERVLHAAIKKECSAVRNKFRTLLLDSTGQEEGKTRMTLEELTWTVLSKYKRGGVGSGSKAEYQLHFAFLRYYGRAHQYVVGRTVSDDSDLESGGEGATQASAKGSTNEPPAKRVRTVSNKAPPGRVKTGYDFWSIIDRVFSKDLDRLGKDMKNDKWREFFNSIVAQDQELYGKNIGSILPPLPSVYTESPATVSSAPRALPTPGNHSASRIAQPSVIRQSSVTNASPQPACGHRSEGLHAEDSNEDLLSENF